MKLRRAISSSRERRSNAAGGRLWSSSGTATCQRLGCRGRLIRRHLRGRSPRQFRVCLACDIRQEPGAAGVQAAWWERWQDLRNVRGQDLDEPRVHGGRRLCQRFDVSRPEPSRAGSGIFVGAENDVGPGQRLWRLRRLGAFGSLRVCLVILVSLNAKGPRRGP
jgi:hypothetical protein